MWECYLDGLCVRSFDNEDEAVAWCEMYDGDKEPNYDYVGESGCLDDISDCGSL